MEEVVCPSTFINIVDINIIYEVENILKTLILTFLLCLKDDLKLVFKEPVLYLHVCFII